jgi:hypothetical protein
MSISDDGSLEQEVQNLGHLIFCILLHKTFAYGIT